MKAPEVSVVVGVRNGIRNGDERLDAALQSLLAQRDVELELIVVDDGSTDGTPQLLAATAARDPRVRLLRQDPLGLTAALIEGCAAARAPFIARQDGDEVSHPDRLHRQLDAFAAHPDLALVSCWTAHVAPGGEPLRIEKGRCAADVPVAMFEHDGGGRGLRVVGPSQHGSTMFPTALYREVGGYRAAFAAGQDWDLWLRLGERGKFFMVGEVLLQTTQDPRSLSFAVRDLQLAFGEASTEALRRRLRGESEAEPLASAEALSRRLAAERQAPPRRRSEALGLYHIGEGLRRQRHPAALSYLVRALRRDPLLLRAWVRAGQAVLARGSGVARERPA